MISYSKKALKELEKIRWLSISCVSKETIAIVLFLITFVLFLGGVNLVLQKSFNDLLGL